MAKKEINNTAMAESVNAFVSGLGEGRLRVVQELNQGNTVEMQLVPNVATGRIEAFIAENNKKVGHVMPADDRTFETLKSKEPATNTLLDSRELLKLIGNKTIPATAFRATSVSIIKLRINSEYLNSSEEIKAESIEVNVEIPIDWDGYTEANKARILDIIEFIKRECSFSSKIYPKIIAAYVDFMRSRETVEPLVIDYVNSDNVLDEVIKKCMGKNKNIWLTGNKGVGKNKLVTQIANIFSLKLYDMTMSRGVERGDIIGERTFNDEGKIHMELSGIIKCLMYGGVCCIDEANLADPAVLAALNSILDERGYVEVPGYGTVKRHPQAIIILTMNESSIDEDYAGTNEMNAAFLDRFYRIHLKSNPDIMKDIFMLKTNLNEADATKLAGYYKIFYNAVYNADDDASIPSKYLSQRAFITAAQEFADGWEDSIESSFRDNVLKPIDDEEIRGILENLILINC